MEKNSSAMHFSPRELQVFKFIILGFSCADIAGELGISFFTVKTYVKSIHKKTNQHAIATNVVWALLHGFTCDLEAKIVCYEGVVI